MRFFKGLRYPMTLHFARRRSPAELKFRAESRRAAEESAASFVAPAAAPLSLDSKPPLGERRSGSSYVVREREKERERRVVCVCVRNGVV